MNNVLRDALLACSRRKVVRGGREEALSCLLPFAVTGILTNVVLMDSLTMTVLLDAGARGAWNSDATHATHVRAPANSEHVDEFYLFAVD